MSKVVDIRNARSDGYRKVLQKIAAQGKCPFCPDNFVYHKRPILQRHGAWFVTRNFKPYPNTRYHFILIGRKHKVCLSPFTAQDFVSIGYLAKWAEHRFGLRGGALAMRFGNSRYTGATVTHVHAHLIVPQLEYRRIDGRNQRVAKVIYFPIG